MGKVARLSSFALLPVEEIGHWLASLYSVFGIYMSAWLSLSGPFQQSDNLFSSIHNLSSILHVLKCWLLCFFLSFLFVFSQQAWPTGTQQILIPSSWQQVPGVAIHGSAHQSNVTESPVETIHSDAATQQGHSWRWVNQQLLKMHVD